jgi:hypothetical protein
LISFLIFFCFFSLSAKYDEICEEIISKFLRLLHQAGIFENIVRILILKRVQDDSADCHAELVAASGNGEAVSASIGEILSKQGNFGKQEIRYKKRRPFFKNVLSVCLKKLFRL